MSDVPITPETRVAHLLEAYPALEEVLVREAPAFERLRNPVLRRTVARLTTLERAAAVAGLDVRTLVRRLREAAGLPAGDDDGGPAADASDPGPPAWRAGRTPTQAIDADVLLARDETPLPHVLAAARALEADGLLEVGASFRPLPLVDALEQQGFRTHLEARPGGGFALYVVPRLDSS